MSDIDDMRKDFDRIVSKLESALDNLRGANTDADDLSARVDDVENTLYNLLGSTSGSDWVSEKITELGQALQEKDSYIEDLESEVKLHIARIEELEDRED